MGWAFKCPKESAILSQLVGLWKIPQHKIHTFCPGLSPDHQHMFKITYPLLGPKWPTAISGPRFWATRHSHGSGPSGCLIWPLEPFQAHSQAQALRSTVGATGAARSSDLFWPGFSPPPLDEFACSLSPSWYAPHTADDVMT